MTFAADDLVTFTPPLIVVLLLALALWRRHRFRQAGYATGFFMGGEFVFQRLDTGYIDGSRRFR